MVNIRLLEILKNRNKAQLAKKQYDQPPIDPIVKSSKEDNDELIGKQLRNSEIDLEDSMAYRTRSCRINSIKWSVSPWITL